MITGAITFDYTKNRSRHLRKTDNIGIARLLLHCQDKSEMGLDPEFYVEGRDGTM